MHRLIVLILSAVDAAIAAAVGLAVVLAPLTLVWVLGLGGSADWAALWPASGTIWQFGNLVPLQVTLPGEYLAVAGIDPAAASFALTLAPLAFAAFTAIFAARSGVRASRADGWLTGVVTGSLTFAGLSAATALTTANELATNERWQAILFPTLVYAVPLLIAAVATEWREAGSGFLARARDRIEGAPRGWGEVPGLSARGAAVVLTGLIGLGSLAFTVALLLRGGEVIALFQAANLDVLGATVVTLAQLAYLPTLVIWGMTFVAGPGFSVGSDTSVSPAGTQLGVIPGIPVLGALPETTTSWLLLLALLPVGLGALAGWIARSRLLAPAAPVTEARPGAAEWDAGHDAVRSSALSTLLSNVRADPPSVEDRLDSPTADAGEPVGARLGIAVGIAVLSGAGAALLSWLASGSIGPGRLAEVGPDPGPVALAVGLEVLVGAAILLLSPRRRARRTSPQADTPEAGADPASVSGSSDEADRGALSIPADRDASPADDERQIPLSDADTAPIALVPPPRSGASDADSTATADLGPRRPQPLPPVD